MIFLPEAQCNIAHHLGVLELKYSFRPLRHDKAQCKLSKGWVGRGKEGVLLGPPTQLWPTLMASYWTRVSQSGQAQHEPKEGRLWGRRSGRNSISSTHAATATSNGHALCPVLDEQGRIQGGDWPATNQDLADPIQSLGAPPADLRLDMSVAMHLDLISGLGTLRPASIPSSLPQD